MNLEDFLKNLNVNNDFYRSIDFLSKPKYEELKLSLASNKSFSDYSREFNWFTIYSSINIEKYKSETKTFVPARKYGNRLYTWRLNQMDYYRGDKYSEPIKIGSEFFLFYNEYGKPTRALLENKLIENVGYNSFKLTDENQYSQTLTEQDIENAKNGYFQYLEIFDSKPFKAKELENFNFIFYGNSPIIEKNEIIFWAERNGFVNHSKKPKQNKKNVLVCLSEFPYSRKALLKTKIPQGLKHNTARISYKDFINIAYNIAYKQDFVFSWDSLKRERVKLLTEYKSFFEDEKNFNKNQRRLTKQIVEELEIQIEELNLF